MVENPAAPSPEIGDGDDFVSAFDAASYIHALSGEMGAMAELHGLSKVAAALELARTLAADAIAAHSGG